MDRNLRRHTSAPCTHVRSLTVYARRLGEHGLLLRYRVEGDPDALRLPAPRPSAHADRLWLHTCFEAFVKPAGARGYLELNFAPSGEWAIYLFDDYRRGVQPRAPRHPPGIVVRQGADRLEVDVRVDFEGLFTESARVDDLRLALAAVLEDRQGRLSYWALEHPSDRPDFHHPDSFALTLSHTP